MTKNYVKARFTRFLASFKIIDSTLIEAELIHVSLTFFHEFKKRLLIR